MVNFIEKRKQTVGFISESSSNEEHDVIQGAAPCRVCVEVEKRCRHLRSPCVETPSCQEIPCSIASAIVTARLKCAPEIFPNARMRASRAAPVAIVFASRAIATLPASRSAMIPEPTTAATKNAVPTNSAAARLRNATSGMREWSHIAMRFAAYLW